MRWASWKVAVVLAGLIGLGGCSLLTPGNDVRQAAEAKSRTYWDKDSNLLLEENTTHNRRVTTVESTNKEGATVEYYADGTAKKVTGASILLTQNSEPRDAMAGYMLLAQKNAEVAAQIMETLQMLIPVLGKQASAGGASSQSDLQAALDRLTPEMRAILEQAIGKIANQPTGSASGE